MLEICPYSKSEFQLLQEDFFLDLKFQFSSLENVPAELKIVYQLPQFTDFHQYRGKLGSTYHLLDQIKSNPNLKCFMEERTNYGDQFTLITEHYRICV